MMRPARLFDTALLASTAAGGLVGAARAQQEQATPGQLGAVMCPAHPPPQGWWIECRWPRLGREAPMGKVSFDRAVGGAPFVVGAGVHHEDTIVEELERISVRAR